MSKFVKKANLPQNTRQLVLGEKYKGLLDNALRNLGIEPVYCPSNPDIDGRLSGHCDLSVFHAGGDTLFLAPYLKNTDFSRALEKYGFRTLFPQGKQGIDYPADASYNLCLLGNTFFYSPKVSLQKISDYLIADGARPFDIKQGYGRCSVCIVNERSIITSDRGVYQRALENGLDCLLISPGYIDLPGFDYGFIGGSSFKISDDRICFTGILDAHPDRQKILNFLEKCAVKPVFLTEMPVFDVGSAVPLTEK